MNPVQYVRDTVDLVKQIETRFLELGARLYNIRSKELWVSTYDSYQEFLDTARVSPSMASMLYSIHKNYVIDGGKDTKALEGIGYSNLYEAIPLIEKIGIEKAITTADRLTRSDVKDMVREVKHGRHIHVPGEARFGVCECGKFVRIES